MRNQGQAILLLQQALEQSDATACHHQAAICAETHQLRCAAFPRKPEDTCPQQATTHPFCGTAEIGAALSWGPRAEPRGRDTKARALVWVLAAEMGLTSLPPSHPVQTRKPLRWRVEGQGSSPGLPQPIHASNSFEHNLGASGVSQSPGQLRDQLPLSTMEQEVSLKWNPKASSAFRNFTSKPGQDPTHLGDTGHPSLPGTWRRECFPVSHQHCLPLVPDVLCKVELRKRRRATQAAR